MTVDLGIMRDVGVIAEHGATDYLKEWEEPFGIRETELHVLIKKIITSELQSSNTSSETQLAPQILTGFATGGTAHMANIRRPFYFDDPRFSMLALTGLSGTPSSTPSGPASKSLTLQPQAALHHKPFRKLSNKSVSQRQRHPNSPPTSHLHTPTA